MNLWRDPIDKQTGDREDDTGVRDSPEKRDNGNDSENDTSDDETNPSTRRDFDLAVIQEVRSRIDG